jgi:hypothetical protein
MRGRVAQLEDLLDDRAVLGLELARPSRRRRLVGPLLDLDVQPAAGAGLGRAEQRAVQAGQRRDCAPPGGGRVSTTSATVPTFA